MNKNLTTVILASDIEIATILYNRLRTTAQIEKVILEKPIARSVAFRRRIKNLGFVTAFGQGLFVGVALPLLRFFAKGRVRTLQQSLSSDTTLIPDNVLVSVDSINNETALHTISQTNPERIIVYGTRLLSRKFLKTIQVPIINMHLGYNPRYRGGNGGYWALTQNDREHCGVTVHVIDEGVDTGDVLDRAVITPTRKDSFVTYPLLQIAAGIPLLENALRTEKLVGLDTSSEPSCMWYHPTILQYIWYRIRGVK